MNQYGYIPWGVSAYRPPAPAERAVPAGGRQLHWLQEACSSSTVYKRQEIKLQRQPKKVVPRKTGVEKELDQMRKDLAKKQREEKKQLESTSKKLATVKKIEAKFKSEKKTSKAVAIIKKKKEPSLEIVYERMSIKKR